MGVHTKISFVLNVYIIAFGEYLFVLTINFLVLGGLTLRTTFVLPQP